MEQSNSIIDSELITIMSKDCHSDMAPDKPLSPILNNSAGINRRHLMKKKTKFKKTRVNLCERFENNSPSIQNSSESLHTNMCSLNKNSLNIEATTVNNFEELEEIEKSRKEFYKLLTSNKEPDLCFKLPKTPPLKPKLPNRYNSDYKNTSDIGMDPEYNLIEENACYNVTSVQLNKSIGFQTAAGRAVQIPDEHLQKQFQLFEDILQITHVCTQRRHNKYNFLSKQKGLNNSTEENYSLRNVEHGQITSSEISDTQMIVEAEKFVKDNNISITTSITNVNNIINEEDFFGFTNIEITDSKKLCETFNKILHTFSMNIGKIVAADPSSDIQSVKRNLEDKSLPSSKRLKQDIYVKGSFQQVYEIPLIKSPLSESNVDSKAFNNLDRQFTDNITGTFSKECNTLPFAKENTITKGFSTGSGQAIHISERALETASKIFLDIETKMTILKPSLNFQEHNMEKNSSSIQPKLSSENNDVPRGFSTALGNSINISENSMRKANQIFNEINSDKSETQAKLFFNDNDVKKLNGFSTASGNRVKISENSLKKANKIFEEINSEATSDMQAKLSSDDVNKPKGFSTASGNRVKISENSLKKANKIFQEVNSEAISDVQTKLSTNESEYISKGFTKASGSRVNVSENSLKKANKIFQEINSDMQAKTCSIGNDVSKCISKGFSTATGNRVNVSENSLKKAKKIFHEINSETTSDMNVKLSTNENDMPKIYSAASGTSVNNNHSNQLENNNLVQSDNIGNGQECDKQINENSESIARRVSRNKLKLLDDAIRKIEHQNGDNYSDQEDLLRKQVLTNITSTKPLNIHANSGTVKLSRRHESPNRETLAKLLPNPAVVGTKSGKKRLGISSCQQISIPEAKLQKAKLLFSEEFSDLSPIKPHGGFNSFASANVWGDKSSTPIANRSMLQVPKTKNNESMETPVEAAMSSVATVNKQSCLSLKSNASIVLTSPTKGDASEWSEKLKEECRKLEEKLSILRERDKQLSLMKRKTEKEDRPRPGVLYRKKKNRERIILRSLVSKDDSEMENLFSFTPSEAKDIHFKVSSAFLVTEDGAIIIPNGEDLIGLTEIEHGFRLMPGVDPALIPKGWVKNHFKWIVWKFVSYERRFSDQLEGILNVENVVQQLKYRYDREIDKAERSALRRIYERDDAPQKRMVLCVSDIRTNHREIELTDGWYAIRTILDAPLYAEVVKGKITIGTKLVVYGAELLNCEGCYPLESTDTAYLKLNYNCTRRAVWYAKLGYQAFPGPFPIRIETVHPSGGTIGAIKLLLVRAYPIKYLEKSENKSVWRNKKAEERSAQEWENVQSKRMEKIQESAEDKLDKLRCRSEKEMESCKEEITISVKENMERLGMTKRNVTSVLRLLVIDTLSESLRTHNFHIWNPSELHLQMLKEGAPFTIFNVLPRTNGDLCSGNKTVFLPKATKISMPATFERRVTSIENLHRSTAVENFREFDSIGIVLKTKIEIDRQELWLCGTTGSLLLVKIYEGPATCALLDNLKRGSATAACNLTYKRSENGINEAVANHSTIFSYYPLHKHLRIGLEAFQSESPKDLDSLLGDCDNKIEIFEQRVSTSVKLEPHSNWDDSEEDLSMSRLTSTDVALSLIDMDKFI